MPPDEDDGRRRIGQVGRAQFCLLPGCRVPRTPSSAPTVRLLREWKESTLRGRDAHEAALRRLPGWLWCSLRGTGRLLIGPWRRDPARRAWLWWAALLGVALGLLVGGWFDQS